MSLKKINPKLQHLKPTISKEDNQEEELHFDMALISTLLRQNDQFQNQIKITRQTVRNQQILKQNVVLRVDMLKQMRDKMMIDRIIDQFLSSEEMGQIQNGNDQTNQHQLITENTLHDRDEEHQSTQSHSYFSSQISQNLIEYLYFQNFIREFQQSNQQSQSQESFNNLNQSIGDKNLSNVYSNQMNQITTILFTSIQKNLFQDNQLSNIYKNSFNRNIQIRQNIIRKGENESIKYDDIQNSSKENSFSALYSSQYLQKRHQEDLINTDNDFQLSRNGTVVSNIQLKQRN